MRLTRLWALGLLFLALPAQAQEDTAFFRVADVSVEATAASAAQARDQALTQAQRQAFEQLLSRMGADLGMAAAIDDIKLAGLVQAFEVQKEYASGQRYTGTFAFQFRPTAVRSYLDDRNMAYTETRARPWLVLPVLRSEGRAILWEEVTPWREAWEEAVRKSSLVPLIVAVGDLDDIAMISTDEALEGQTEHLNALAHKYNAQGVVVAILSMDLGSPDGKKEGVIEAQRFAVDGQKKDPIRLTLAPVADVASIPASVAKGAQAVIADIETGWRKKVRAAAVAGPPSTLPVNVPVPTLAAWAKIRSMLTQSPAVVRVTVVTMTRGLVNASIDYRGDIAAFQAALAEQGLALVQDSSGAWTLSESAVSE